MTVVVVVVVGDGVVSDDPTYYDAGMNTCNTFGVPLVRALCYIPKRVNCSVNFQC